jgi:TIR domain-containing protein/WD40 repeat protein
MAQLFISYSRKDLDFVRQLASDLKNAGFEVWYDVSRLEGGARWRAEIENALRNSEYVIFVLSPDSTSSEWVEREFLFANSLKRKLIPLMYRHCDLPLNYINLNYIDVQGDKYSENFGHLLKALSIDPGVVTARPENLWSRLRTRNAILIGAGTIITAVLLSFALLRNVFVPVPVPTGTGTAPPTAALPTQTPRPTATAVITWQQGKIAFVVRNTEKVYFLYIQELANNGQPELLLTPDNPSASRYYAPWFSPDGGRLVFHDFYNGTIFVMDSNGNGKPRPLGKCASPSLAPDGIRVVCDSSGADYFRVFDVETGNNLGKIQHSKSGSVIPAWSPDGKEIAFSVFDQNRNTTLWKVSVDGGHPLPLATGATENYAPSWSPDGEWIAYQSTQESERSEVWIMRSDGSDKRQLTFSGGGENWSRGPCFSPDGKWLAFVSNQKESDGPDFGDVFIVSLATGEVTQITHTGGYVLDWRVTWGR